MVKFFQNLKRMLRKIAFANAQWQCCKARSKVLEEKMMMGEYVQWVIWRSTFNFWVQSLIVVSVLFFSYALLQARTAPFLFIFLEVLLLLLVYTLMNHPFLKILQQKQHRSSISQRAKRIAHVRRAMTRINCMQHKYAKVARRKLSDITEHDLEHDHDESQSAACDETNSSHNLLDSSDSSDSSSGSSNDSGSGGQGEGGSASDTNDTGSIPCDLSMEDYDLTRHDADADADADADVAQRADDESDDLDAQQDSPVGTPDDALLAGDGEREDASYYARQDVQYSVSDQCAQSAAQKVECA